MPLPPEFHELARKVNNWGRWGDGDELGTLNLITPEVVQRAVASVVTGETYSLALPLSADGPQTGAIRNRINPIRTMVAVHDPLSPDPDGIRANDDIVVMGLQAATHWDALAHVSYGGRVWNGFGADAVDAQGAHRGGIHNIRTLVTRGVLLDVARALGQDWLAPGYGITPADLDACAVAVEPGDAVLVRTGHVGLFKRGNRHRYAGECPGLTMATALWFHERDVAAVAIDTLALDVYPPERADCFLPVHMLHLVEMGLTQGQNFDLEDLAAACAADHRFTFMLAASPEPFVNGLGAPVNPVAIR